VKALYESVAKDFPKATREVLDEYSSA